METTVVNSNEEKTTPKTKQIVLAITTVLLMVRQSLTPTKNFLTKPTQTIQIFKKTESLDLSTVHLPSETGGKTNHSTEKFYFGANASNRPPQNTRPEGQNQFQQRNS